MTRIEAGSPIPSLRAKRHAILSDGWDHSDRHEARVKSKTDKMQLTTVNSTARNMRLAFIC